MRYLLPLALIVGILRDAVSYQTFGVETLSVGIASWLLVLLIHKTERYWFLVRMLTGGIFVLTVLMLTYFLSRLVGMPVPGLSVFFSVATASALCNAIVLPLFSVLAEAWFHETKFTKQYELFYR